MMLARWFGVGYNRDHRDAGIVFAQDDNEAIVTSYDQYIFLMPLQRLQQGQTALRLGRYIG